MEADKALKNYKTIPTIKIKLDELEKEKGTTWVVFMEALWNIIERN